MNINVFENLPVVKQKAILNAGLLCFSQNGYKKTAISEIAKEAQISKAAIFHYFETKKDLYIYLYQYAFEKFFLRSYPNSDDFFECMYFLIQNWVQVEKEHPRIYEFITSQSKIKENDTQDIFHEIENLQIEEYINNLCEEINWIRFKDEYNRKVVINLTSWIFNGCLIQSNEVTSREDVTKELDIYLNIIKKSLYKSEYL